MSPSHGPTYVPLRFRAFRCDAGPARGRLVPTPGCGGRKPGAAAAGRRPGGPGTESDHESTPGPGDSACCTQAQSGHDSDSESESES